MKLLTLTILLFSVVVINCKARNKKSGKNSNGHKSGLPDSVAWGYATNNDYTLQNAAVKNIIMIIIFIFLLIYYYIIIGIQKRYNSS